MVKQSVSLSVIQSKKSSQLVRQSVSNGGKQTNPASGCGTVRVRDKDVSMLICMQVSQSVSQSKKSSQSVRQSVSQGGKQTNPASGCGTVRGGDNDVSLVSQWNMQSQLLRLRAKACQKRARASWRSCGTKMHKKSPAYYPGFAVGLPNMYNQSDSQSVSQSVSQSGTQSASQAVVKSVRQTAF